MSQEVERSSSRASARRGSGAVLLFVALLLAAPPSTATGPAASLPSDEELERRGARIGAIDIRVEDVFDPELPEENRRLFRLANHLHMNTRPAVIRAQLLFAPGELYSARLLRESERLIRANKYLYDCTIRPVAYDGDLVHLEVWVKDVWTLKAAIALSRSGGVNSTRVELQDINLLGSGKAVTLRRERDVDRSSVSVRYLDNNVLGSRGRVSFVFSDDSDGERISLEAGRPFFALDTRWAAGFDGETADRTDSLYSLGEIAREFRHRQDSFELSGGLSRGLVGGRARRLLFGLTYAQDRFAPLTAAAADPLPADRTLVYPWIGFESVQDAFTTTHNFDQLRRTEDLLLGSRLRARLGFASAALGSDRDLAVFDARAEHGWKPSPRQTLLLASELSGRWGGDGVEDLLLVAGARYYWRNAGPHLFFATLEAGVARNLDRENQLLLGGDSGLRGYPLRYQDGEGRLLLTLEQRFFTGLYLFRLFHVGAAVFVDVGRTWAHEEALSPNLGLLRNVGAGLRLGSSRSGFGSVVHLDVAFPLDGDPSIDRVQWLVTTKESL